MDLTEVIARLLAAPETRAVAMWALVVLGIIAFIAAWRAGTFRAQHEAAEGWESAADAEERLRKAALAEAEIRIGILQQASLEAERMLAKECAAFDAKLNAMRAGFESEIAELRSEVAKLRRALSDFGCKRAPTCDNRDPVEVEV